MINAPLPARLLGTHAPQSKPKEIADLLRAVKKHLPCARGGLGSHFICVTLHWIQAASDFPRDHTDWLDKEIAYRLDRSYTLESWLSDKHGVEVYSHDGDREQRILDMQEFRHRWLDSLIAEFSADDFKDIDHV